MSVKLREETGAILVLYAILLVTMLIMSAIVIDVAALRLDRRASRLTADLAAVSGAMSLQPDYGGGPLQACEAAWAYFLINTGDVPDDADTSSPCAAVYSDSDVCDPSTAVVRTAQKSVGPYSFTVFHPVPDDHELMDSRLEPLVDGNACERMAVEIARTRGFVFGSVVGLTGGSTRSASVAMSFSGTTSGELVSLVLLDPVGCKSLYVSGQGGVRVLAVEDNPGIITLDSAGTHTGGPVVRNCTNSTQDYVVDVSGEEQGLIEAQDAVVDGVTVAKGSIFDFALMPGQGTAFAYEKRDVNNGRLIPRPIANDRITRRPIDNRYNCNAANNCPFTSAPYIDQHRAAYGGTGAPAGFSDYTAWLALQGFTGKLCETQSSDPAIVVPPGNWFVNCPGSSPKGFVVGNSITFLGPSKIVFQGSVNVSGSLCINVDALEDCTNSTKRSSNDGWIYLRSGDFERGAQAQLNMQRNFVFIEDGRINLGAGAGEGPLIWIAPEDKTNPFDDLALWSESPLEDDRGRTLPPHEIGGQGNLGLEGVFFIPNALFRYSGQGVQVQKKAQFVAFRIDVSGQGILEMEPDPDRIVLIPILGVRLVR